MTGSEFVSGLRTSGLRRRDASGGEQEPCGALHNQRPHVCGAAADEDIVGFADLEPVAGSAAERRTRVETLIEDALKARKIVPAQRGQYEALCSTDAGLAHVASLFAATVPHLQPSGLDGRLPDTGEVESPITLAARATRYGGYGRSRFDNVAAFASTYDTPGWQRAQRGAAAAAATPVKHPPRAIEGELVAKSTVRSAMRPGRGCSTRSSAAARC